MHLLQLQEKLVYLHIKEPGVGVVGLVIRHGMLLDCQKAHQFSTSLFVFSPPGYLPGWQTLYST